MNSGDIKMYKYVKISKSNFFTITILSIHSTCSESKIKMKMNFKEYSNKIKENITIDCVCNDNNK